MDQIIAVAVELESGRKRYFLTWGRIQEPVQCDPLEELLLRHADKFDLGGKPMRARVCDTLQEAASQPYFFECFFEMSSRGIPSGKRYGPWRRKIGEQMKRGKEFFYLGNSEAVVKSIRKP
ncbi:MAG TPA: hypothetical protein VM222_07315 [Planctomycetota bacterium]|nr:hypothetical protein [Planctomycetota bacterium]